MPDASVCLLQEGTKIKSSQIWTGQPSCQPARSHMYAQCRHLMPGLGLLSTGLQQWHLYDGVLCGWRTVFMQMMFELTSYILLFDLCSWSKHFTGLVPGVRFCDNFSPAGEMREWGGCHAKPQTRPATYLHTTSCIQMPPVLPQRIAKAFLPVADQHHFCDRMGRGSFT